MYDQPIHPKTLWMHQGPLQHEKVDEIYRENIRKLLERGSYSAPYYSFQGCHYQGEATTPEQWQELKKLWDGWGADV